MTEKQLEANRRNALKSTGPKTLIGKARSSKNALKHGVLTTCPVLPGVESLEEWERHREGLFKSLAPVGYFEELLANRLAIISWRASRVVRFESEMIEASIATVESDLEADKELISRKPSYPAKAREEAVEASGILEALDRLPDTPPDVKIHKGVASAVLWALYEELPDDCSEVAVPGIPDDDAEYNAFEKWTFGLLRNAIAVYAAAAGMSPEAMRNKCIVSASETRNLAKARQRTFADQKKKWEFLVERETRRRTLLAPDALEKVARYESNLERSFFKTLHELQRIQAVRLGAFVPTPAAVDVEMTVHQEGAS